MKITVINGNMRKGSTWNSADAVIKALGKYSDTQVTEFFLPKDMPHFCVGCYNCFYKGESACPHASSVQPIAEAIIGADLIVLTSPVYALDVSGQMKALLDHLCYQWVSHRPNPAMFSKIGLTVSSTAGAGLGPASKTMKRSLSYWGVKKVFSLKVPAAAMQWGDVSEKNRTKIAKKADKLAARIVKSVRNADKGPNPLFRSFFFFLMKSMQKKNEWNKTDRSHWEKNGWLSGGKPF